MELSNISNDKTISINENSYIQQLEMSVELLQREIEHLRSKQKPKSRRLKSGVVESAFANLFSAVTSEQDVLLLYIEHIIKDIFVYETDLFIYDSTHKLLSATANQSAEKLEIYIRHYEESGICDWISEKKLAGLIPNLDDASGEFSNASFLLVPLLLRDSVIGFAVSRTNLSPLELDESQLSSITEQAYYVALALDNIKSKAEIQKMNARLQTFSQHLTSPKEADSISEITNSISEEISNSVKIIQANISLIENGVGDYLQRLGTIKQQVELVNLLNSKLLFISGSIHENTSEIFSFTAVVEDILLFSNSQLQRDGITIHKQFETNEILIQGSKSKLEQALLNVILFSRDKLEEGGKIEISLFSSRNNKANLMISDNSIGLNPSEEATVFEHYLVNPDKSESITGLHLANSIITNYDGKLEVVSEFGKGITYKIALPLYKSKKK